MSDFLATMTPADWLIASGVIALLFLLLYYMAEVILSLLFVACIIVVICVMQDAEYYGKCTGVGQSYLHCFYDRVIKP